MKAGFCERDITPAIGMEKPGGYSKVYISEIHDSLKVRASVFDDGKEKVALVGIDTLAIQSSQAVKEIRKEVEKRCGIKGDCILIAASHDHSAGPFFGPLPEKFKDAPALIKSLALNHSVITDSFYYQSVINQTVSAICEAEQNKKEVLLSVGSGYEDKACYNRRFKMKNARTYTHPGKGNPEIIGPSGPIDPEVGVLAAWEKNGKLLGCVVNYACHATTAPFKGVSADWIYFLENTIQGVYGRDANVVFLNGACGDITQVNNLSLEGSDFGERVSRIVGQRVGAEALKVLATAFPGELKPIKAASRVLRFKRRKPGKEHLKKSFNIVKSSPKNSTAWTFAKEVIVLNYLVKKEPCIDAEVQAIQIGPAIFLSNPAEYFCQLGLDIKKKSPFPFTYIVELANGCVGYVPTEEAFNSQGGGYETVLTSYSNLEISAGEKIVETCVELANKLKPGKIPECPKVKPSTEPWGYGILGPELE